jgi:nucleotide-binding universal stress UspA family protein
MAEYIADVQSKSIRRVLCATDLTGRSAAALHRAVALARQTGARLTVVHATNDRQPERIVRLQINRACVQLLSKFEESLGSEPGFIDVVIRAGNPREVIANTAEECDADLVVVAAPRSRRSRASSPTCW